MIAITGANGLVGNYVSRLLLSHGKAVRLLVRNANDPALQNLHEKVEIVETDILDTLGLQKAFEGVQAVAHTAAVVSFWRRKHSEMLKINVEGTNNVVNVALQMGVKRLVYVSSIAALGRSELGSGVLDEQSAWTNSSQNSMYARSKYKAELAVLRGIEEGLNAVIVNPGVILGLSEWSRSSSNIFRKMANRQWFFPPGGNGFVGANDVAKVIALLIDREDFIGERFILVSENLSYQQVFASIAKAFGNDPPTIKIHAQLILLAGIVSELISLISQKEPFVSLESTRTAGKTYQ